MQTMSGSAFAATLLLAVLAELKCESAPSVIIVGAGPAGIAAATKLLENNITNITVLEANGRIGGRIYSVEFGNATVDLGAQWCHGEEDNIVYELVKDLDLLESDEGVQNYYHSSIKNINQSFIEELWEIFSSCNEGGEEENETSVGDYMIGRYNESVMENFGDEPEKLKLAWEALDSFMRYTLSLESAFSWFDTSIKSDYIESKGNQHLGWKQGGYKMILDVLMKKYPNPEEQLSIDDKIILNKEVVKIVWDSAKQPQTANVECLDGSVYSADHVIFTPSLGVLKDRHETLFQPPLPNDKVTAIEKLGIGAVIKVFLYFPEKWWSESNVTHFTFIWSEEDKQSILLDFPEGPNKNGVSWLTNILGVYEENSPNVLSAWLDGELVPQIEQCSDDTIVDGLLFAMNKFLKHQFGEIPKPDAIVRHSWYSDPHFRGTYSFQTVESRKGNVSAEVILSEPLTASNGKQTLLFAGEATHPYHYSTVHGAIETGHREANRIINFNE